MRRTLHLRTTTTVLAVIAGVGLLTSPGSAARQPSVISDQGVLRLASTSADGGKDGAQSTDPSLNADGTLIAFDSQAMLAAGDHDAIQDAYVKNLITGEVSLISTSATGVKGNARSSDVQLSADGSTAAFISMSDNLHPGDTDFKADVFIKDLATGALMLASTSKTGEKANCQAARLSSSADGTVIAFESCANNLGPADTDEWTDIYVKNILTGDVVLASLGANIDGEGDVYGTPSLSADGTAVAFSSHARLVPADTDDRIDVYVKDLVTGRLTLVSTTSEGGNPDGYSASPSLSRSGDTAAFESSAKLHPDDPDNVVDVFVKNLVSDEITLASTSDEGVKSNGSSQDPRLSEDGTRVAFHSEASNLDPADSNGFVDAYLKDFDSGDLVWLSEPHAGGQSDGNSYVPLPTPDGERVAFFSNATNLDPADSDDAYDVYVWQAKPEVLAADSSPREGDRGRPTHTVLITLSEPSIESVTVTFTTADGSALAGHDYVATSGFIVFEPGHTQRKIRLRLIADRLDEPNETLRVVLSDAVGAVLNDTDAEITIRDDD